MNSTNSMGTNLNSTNLNLTNPNLWLTLVPLVVGTDVLAHPDLAGDALQAQVEGDVRHAARAALGPAGFLVDVVWNEPALRDKVRQAVRNEIARAQAGPLALAPPAAGPGRGVSTACDSATLAASGGAVSLPYITFVDNP